MAVKTRDELKGRFQDGDIPTGADFTDLIDSAAQPSEIPAAPNLAPYLTSATAASTYQTQAGLAAAVDPLLPGYLFDEGFTVGTETDGVTPITLDNAFVQALFTTYLQSLPGYVNNNTVSLRGNMTWETAGASLVTPAAPTTPVTNDTSFGWTDTGGKTFADAEVKIGAAAYVQANGNPHTGITGAYAPGEVLVRYKAVNGVSTVSAALANTVAFTEPEQGGEGTGTVFVTSYSTGTARNDFSANLGYKITVGNAPITVDAIGRWIIAGNDDTHTLKIVTAANATVASVSLNTVGKTPGAFAYAGITPVVLSANTVYYVFSSEVTGQDQWYDNGGTPTPVLTNTNVAVVNMSAYETGGTITDAPSGVSYVPVSFKYTV